MSEPELPPPPRPVPTARRSRTPGVGSLYLPTYTTRSGERRRAGVWWLKIHLPGGTVHRESTHTSKKTEAREALKRKIAALGTGRLSPDAHRVTYDDLEAALLNDYRANRRPSLGRVEDACAHLREFFGRAKTKDLTSDRVTAFMVWRQQQGAQNATINRELSALKRMLRLGEIAGKVDRRPHVAMLQERNVRTGFFEPEAFDAVLRHLPVALRPLFEVAYVTGWRVADELLTRTRAHVDLGAGWLRLEPGETKNEEGRNFPLTPELREILAAQLRHTAEVERATGRIIPWLFHPNGAPIKSDRRAWRTACRKAGVPGRLPHDLRRTAVRNLERARVPRSAAMKMVGHKTESVYRRYAIVDEASLREGAERLAALHAEQDAGRAPRERRIP
jgi:integrase